MARLQIENILSVGDETTPVATTLMSHYQHECLMGKWITGRRWGERGWGGTLQLDTGPPM